MGAGQLCRSELFRLIQADQLLLMVAAAADVSSLSWPGGAEASDLWPVDLRVGR